MFCMPNERTNINLNLKIFKIKKNILLFFNKNLIFMIYYFYLF